MIESYAWILSDVPRKITSTGAYGILISPSYNQSIDIDLLSVLPQVNNQVLVIRQDLPNGTQEYFNGTVAFANGYNFPDVDHIGSFRSPAVNKIRIVDGDELRIQCTAVAINDVMKIEVRGITNVYAKPTITAIAGVNQDYGSGLTNIHKFIGVIK